MARRKRYLTATMPDGYVKTIGPTATAFTHYWRIVADLGSGRNEIFWGHSKSLKEATASAPPPPTLRDNAAGQAYVFEVVELTETPAG